MDNDVKYVIFYCDNCDLLAETIRTFAQLYPGIPVKMLSDLKALASNLRQRPPAFVLVYMTRTDDSTMDVVREIRDHAEASSTQVVIYKSLPDELEMAKLKGL